MGDASEVWLEDEGSRADLIIQMQKEISKIEEVKTKVEKEMTWLKKEEVEAGSKAVNDFLLRWSKLQEEQAEKPGHEAPVFTKKQVEVEAEKAFAEIRRLSRVKKPKERKPSATKSSTSKSKKDSKQLDADIKKVEADIVEIQTKKMAAVEEDDFDKAETLKKQEEAEPAADAESADAASADEKTKGDSE